MTSKYNHRFFRPLVQYLCRRRVIQNSHIRLSIGRPISRNPDSNVCLPYWIRMNECKDRKQNPGKQIFSKYTKIRFITRYTKNRHVQEIKLVDYVRELHDVRSNKLFNATTMF